MADPNPTTLAFLLCDNVRPRHGTATHLDGLHHVAQATAVPAVRPELCIYWLATGMTPGRHAFQLVLTDADDAAIWPRTPVEFAVGVSGPRATVEWSARVYHIPFPAFGEYRWQIRENGVAVAERRYLVAPAPRPEPPARAPHRPRRQAR
jgi:hypothetical protein